MKNRVFFEETEYGVLDHGFVRIVDYMGDDSAIVQAARVSYGDGTKSTREDAELINYLMRHRHTTPFEMCEIKLHLKMPIFVARQWIRHRTASINEYSCRYSAVKDDIYFPDEDRVCGQSSTNKQASGDVLSGAHAAKWLKSTETVQGISAQIIALGESMGIVRELNRINMTVAHYTEFYWKIDLHNLFHFLALRMNPHAQREIREYADAIAKIVSVWVPAAWQAFCDYRLSAEVFTGKELAYLGFVLDDVYKEVAALPEKPNGFSDGEWREFVLKLDNNRIEDVEAINESDSI